MCSSKRLGFLLLLTVAACAEEVPDKDVAGNREAPLENRTTDALILDLYDVKDLTIPIQSFPGCNGLCDCERDEDGFNVVEEPDLAFEGDDLAGLIRGIIDPEIWSEGADSREGSVVGYREGGCLIVRAPEATHERIRKLLAAVRQAVPITEPDSGR